MDNQVGDSIPLQAASLINPDLPVSAIVVAAGILLLLVTASALLSGSEIAFFSLNSARVNALKGNRASVVQWLWNRPEKLLATILIYNNLVNISIILLATWMSGKIFSFEHYWMKFIVDVVLITCLIVLFCELFPKILANIRPVGLAMVMANPLRIAMVLIFPLILALVKSTVFIDRRLKKKNIDISREDLNEAISYSTKIASADVEEARLLKGIINFGDKEVTEIMTSRLDVVGISDEETYDGIIEIIKESGYSRYPVYHENIDNVIGVLHIKDILPYLDDPGKASPWQKRVRPVHVIPENKNSKDLLKEFQRKKRHMAVVVDEFGGLSGLITLEDVIEEIVGDISDEFDEESDVLFYRKLGENLWEFEGKALINDFLKVLDISDDYSTMAKGEADTLAGFILEIKGDIPEKNEKITYQSLQFTIKEVDKRRITRIVVELKKPNE
jgi:putative hemolysin